MVALAGSFEVTVDSVLVFSKLERGRFPDFAETTDVVQQAAAGEQPATVVKTQSHCCLL